MDNWDLLHVVLAVYYLIVYGGLAVVVAMLAFWWIQDKIREWWKR